jgi:hypothetical protein
VCPEVYPQPSKKSVSEFFDLTLCLHFSTVEDVCS